MKQKIIKIFSSVVLISVFLSGVAFADGVLYGQTGNSATATPNTTALGTAFSGGVAAKGQKLGTNLYGTVATTTIYLADGGGLGAITPAVRIECYDDAGYTTFNSGCSSSLVTTPAENGSAKHLVNISTPLVLNTAKWYRLGIGCSAGCSGGTNPNLITYGSNTDLYSGGDFSTGLNITDVYFDLYGNAAAGIQISNVADGGTYADFNDWQVNLLATGLNIDAYTDSKIKVSYKVAGATDYQYADTSDWRFPNSPTNFPIAKSQSLIQRICTSALECFTGGGSANGSQTWTAKVEVFDSSGQLLAGSTEISFTINDIIHTIDYNSTSTIAVSPLALPDATSTASLGLSYQSCGGITDVVCGLKNTAIFLVNVLFIPGNIGVNSTAFLSSAYHDFQGVFPFNVFFSFTNEVGSEITNYSGTATSTVQILKFPGRAADSITLIPASGAWSALFGSDFQLIIYNFILLMGGLVALKLIYEMLFHKK